MEREPCDHGNGVYVMKGSIVAGFRDSEDPVDVRMQGVEDPEPVPVCSRFECRFQQAPDAARIDELERLQIKDDRLELHRQEAVKLLAQCRSIA